MVLATDMSHDPDHPRHGTASGYTSGHCRCDRCRAAITENARRYRQTLTMLAPDDERHGTMYAYSTYRCRCDECAQARRDYAEVEKKRRQLRAEAAGRDFETRRRPGSISAQEAMSALVRFLTETGQHSRDDYTTWRATQDWSNTPSGHAIRVLFKSWPEALEQATPLAQPISMPKRSSATSR